MIVALALVTITVRVALPLYQTLATLLLAYLLMFLPRALVGLRASIAQAPIELERAAIGLGKPPLIAIWKTTARLAAPGAAASAALVALGIANELTGTLMLAPNGVRTLATRLLGLHQRTRLLLGCPLCGADGRAVAATGRAPQVEADRVPKT